jgi:hypothetical protein
VLLIDLQVKVGEWPTGGLGDGLGQFGVERVVTLPSLGFLYASNDATQSVSVFAVDEQSGQVDLLIW